MMPWLILLIILFCALLAISSSIITELKSTDELGCNIRSTTIYNRFYLIILLLVFVIVAPLLMIIFEFLTMQNKRLAIDQLMVVSKYRLMEANLTKLVLVLVTAHITHCLPEWISLRPNQHLHSNSFFLRNIPVICFLIEGKQYRRDHKKMMPYKPTQINERMNNDAADPVIH